MSEGILYVTEADERVHLQDVRDKLRLALELAGGSVTDQYKEVMAMKRYLQDSKRDMDHIEKAGLRESIDQMSRIGEHGMAQAQRLSRLYQSPYFGRIDVEKNGCNLCDPIYIGIHGFDDDETKEPLIHDWRAPISSMFYDFELGDAFFEAPDGRVDCRIALKRQYRIRQGNLEFMLETALNIQDDVLQEELSRSADDRMRNIVATIQRDQNAIIRDDETHALVIQGVAGSGKTSIALHRIAYLLYKFKDVIRSEDILILSPNKVFAHYISQVLPELGEEMIQETTMEVLASHLLEHKVKFQTFSDQVGYLLEATDSSYAERVRYKASLSFLDQIHEYATYVANHNLRAHDLDGDIYFVTAYRIKKLFRQCGAMPYRQQVAFVTDAVTRMIQNEFGETISKEERASIRKQLQGMFLTTDIRRLYKRFYEWLGRSELFTHVKRGVYEYSDVFPLIYLSMLLEGESVDERVKHLVIDEMQDYTAVQYQVLSRLFPCRKTILGDVHQSVNPLSASAPDIITQIVPRSVCMKMTKSYRSTVEIMALAQLINPNTEMVTIERHGDTPALEGFDNRAAEVAHIQEKILAFLDDGRLQTFGIIAKTSAQAAELFTHLHEAIPEVQLLDTESTTYRAGVIVTTSVLAKGLEFDCVVVPFCTRKNYRNEVDRHMLYVAVTRAMHWLGITFTGRCSHLVDGKQGSYRLGAGRCFVEGLLPSIAQLLAF